MKRLHDKDRLWFTMLWIGLYVAGSGTADGLSGQMGLPKSITFLFHAGLSLFALVWLGKHDLFRQYGLCKSDIQPSKFLYYIPLVFLASCNLWYGTAWNRPLAETVCYIGSMCCVGFLEELIFRGFLFRALEREGVTCAIAVSSITFGLGHIINLFNGSGIELLSNLCQVCSATAFGFLFVILFYQGKSLLPCIAAHSTINALSAFANEAGMTPGREITMALVLCVTAAGYGVILNKRLFAPAQQKG